MEEHVVFETQKLRKDFGGLVAVDNVNLRVAEHSLHSIIGPNGAGKTTLFNLLSGTFPPSGGKVIYNGQDITKVPAYQRAHMGIGRSFQITNLFSNLTVFENVRLAAQALGRDSFKFWHHHHHFQNYEERADKAISTVGLGDHANLPARVLSHGNQRKLELAILLAADPETLLLDEPTAGMAREEIPRLMEIIQEIRNQGKKTVLLVEHKMDLVMNVSDKITVMHQGRVLAEGTPNEISANGIVQSAYLGDLYGDFSEVS